MLDHLAAAATWSARAWSATGAWSSPASARAGGSAIEAKRAKWQGRWEQALADVDAAELRAATRVLTRLQAVFEDGVADPVPTHPDCAAVPAPE